MAVAKNERKSENISAASWPNAEQKGKQISN